MRYGYRNITEIKVVRESDLSFRLIADFFLDYAYDLMYVENEAGNLLAVFNEKTAFSYISQPTEKRTVDVFGFDQDNLKDTERETDAYLDDFFFNHPDMFRCPVIQNNKLVGEYYIVGYFGKNVICKYNDFATPLVFKYGKWVANFLNKIEIKNIVYLGEKQQWNEFLKAMDHYCGTIDTTDNPEDPKLLNGVVISSKYPVSMLQNIKGYSIYEIAEAAFFSFTMDYLEKRKIHYCFFDGPDKHKLSNLYEDELKAIKYQSDAIRLLQDQEYLSKIYGSKAPVTKGTNEYFNGLYYCLNDIETADYHVIDGLRYTVGSPKEATIDVHMFGPCITQGFFVSDGDTVSSQLQRQFTERDLKISVINHGMYSMGSLLNSCLAILDTPLREGDYVFELNTCFPLTRNLIKNRHINYDDLTELFQTCHYWFFNHPFHCNRGGNEIISKELFKYVDSQISATGNYEKYFPSDAKNRLSEYVSQNIETYLNFLRENAFHTKTMDSVSSIVMTADPFTFGHLYLVEEALKHSDYLYVFVVQENNGTYSFEDRIEIVKCNLKKYKNVKVLPTGELLHSIYTFPEYNFRGRDFDKEIDPIQDIRLFGEIIAPALGITKRFFGDEPLDKVTSIFNEYAKKHLPTYGISVDVIPRLKINGEYISGSKARMAAMANDSNLERLVPSETIRVLKLKGLLGRSYCADVSVIIPAYNAEYYLDKAIESACYQTGDCNVEIIVVNDGSNDSTGTIIKKWEQLDPRIVSISLEQNRGLSSARNIAMDKASGKYMMFLDADDRLSPEMVSSLFVKAEKYRADISVCRFKKVISTDYPLAPICDKYSSGIRLFNGYEASKEFLSNRESSQNRPFCSRVMFKLYRKEFVGNFRFREGKKHEDEFFTYQLYRKAARIVYNPLQMYFLLVRPDSLSNKQPTQQDYYDTIEALKERNDFYKENELKELAISDYHLYLNTIIDDVNQLFPGSDLLQMVRDELEKTKRGIIL